MAAIRDFLLALLLVITSLTPAASQETRGTCLTHGPFLGHCDEQSAKVWCRTAQPGRHTLVVEGLDGDRRRIDAESTPEHDQCLVWNVMGAKPDTCYRFSIEFAGQPAGNAVSGVLRTASVRHAKTTVSLGFGSCAFDAVQPRFKQPVWTRMHQEKLDAIVLLGDTPYIESPEVSVQRRRYREFYALPELAAAFREMPFYGIWDDHDFGPNDSLGNLPGKAGSRQAFLEFHANPSYGHDDQGIYTSFRRGPVEVFLLDTRWFANTERSPANKERMTLLGTRQWDWLTKALRNSTADVKILASGMIWNEAVYPGKLDAWVAYPYERHALFRFIHDNKISGVVLVSGDIHLSRTFAFPVNDFLSYPMYEFVSSPLAETVAMYNDIPSPYLKFSKPLENVFLKMTIDSTKDTTTLTAEYLTPDQPQPHYRLQLNAATDLTPRPK